MVNHDCIGFWSIIIITVCTVFLSVILFLDSPGKKLILIVSASLSFIGTMVILLLHPCAVALVGFVLSIFSSLPFFILLFKNKSRKTNNTDVVEDKKETSAKN